jgi:hypothetical protein
MFPNVRLMIVAVLASVVAMSCGFGMFAVLRVNHEPLSRLPAGAPLQLIADNSVPRPITLGATGSFGTRFDSGEAQIAATTAGISELKFDRRSDPEPPVATVTIAAAPEPATAEPASAQQQTAAVAAATADIPAPQPPVAAPTADISAPQPPVATPTADAPPPQPPAAEAVAPAQPLQAADAAQDEKAEGVADTTGTVSVAKTPGADAIDLPPDQVARIEQTEKEVTPATAASARNVARKDAARRRIATERRRAVAPHARAAVQFANQNPVYPQPNYQLATQSAPRAAAPVVRQVLVRRRPAKKPVIRTAPAKETAVGGPFVPAPPQ